MSAFLPKLLDMSLTASVAILFVLLLRLLLKRAPKAVSYALWAVVLFRLLCPVAVGSEMSLFNLFDAPTAGSGALTSSIEYVPVETAARPAATLPAPVAGAPAGAAPIAEEPPAAKTEIPAYGWLWMTGVLGMAAYSAVTYIRLKRNLLASVPLRDNIHLADGISSPFVMGLIRPKIYLPSSLAEREQDYIILHEQHHIKRLDHISKALAFAALCVHWFNPLVWLAFILSGKDMEMSCDEAVIKKLGEGVRADYSASLLSLATGRRVIAGAPLAFGEGDTKGRIKNLANWRKPAFWVVLASVIACAALAVGLLTNPSEKEPDLSFLNYENAVSIVADMEELTAIYCPPAQNGSDNVIQIGAASGPELAKYLDLRDWRECAAPRHGLPTPGSVEFVISEDYRITVHDRKSGSLRSYAEIYHEGDGMRYYRISREDYEEAVSLVHPREDAYYLRIGAEGVTNIEVSTPNSSGGYSNADGSPFEVGEEVYLEMLDGVTNLQGVSVTAMNADGAILYARSFPEDVPDHIAQTVLEGDTWLIVPAGLTFRWFTREYIEWFNYLDSPADISRPGRGSIELAVFPGVTFRWVPEEITAETENGTALLISGMPIWNAYLADLNGDGMPEICATATIGSGVIDSRIIVHDYAAGETYELEDRGEYDYALEVRDGRLLAVQSEYNEFFNGEPVAYGALSLADRGDGARELRVEWSPMEEPAPLILLTDVDLDHDGKTESVQLETIHTEQLYRLNVVKEDGSILWSEEVGIPHVAWNTILLYRNDGKDYLIRYLPTIYHGDGTYRCTLFSLEGGRENVIDSWSVDFDRVDFTKPLPITDEMQDFADAVNPLLEQSTLLVTTEQLELVMGPIEATKVPQIYPVRFDPDEIQQAMNEALAPGIGLIADFLPLDFRFMSGTGAWETSLTLYRNGSFEGQYLDSDMGLTDPVYPGGTAYVCNFGGRFTNITQTGEHSYSMRLETLNHDAADQTWIEDQIRYVTAEPYGVAGGEEFILYLPDTPVEGLNEEFLSWRPYRDGSTETLSAYGLYNVNTGEGFFSERLP